jgi:hypothetical protein
MTCMQKPLEVSAALQPVVIPDLQIVRDIGTALNLRDEVALWAAARRAESQEAFYEQLRAQVGYTTFSGTLKRIHKSRLECHVALFGVPVLLASSDAALVGNSQDQHGNEMRSRVADGVVRVSRRDHTLQRIIWVSRHLHVDARAYALASERVGGPKKRQRAGRPGS